MINQMSSEIESYCKESAKNLESNRKKKEKKGLSLDIALHKEKPLAPIYEPCCCQFKANVSHF